MYGKDRDGVGRQTLVDTEGKLITAPGGGRCYVVFLSVGRSG
jgi:hypothetical protein